jgi:mono/diheme cytochrome c family protein
MGNAWLAPFRGKGLLLLAGSLATLIGLAGLGGPGADGQAPGDRAAEYTTQVRPLLTKYCLGCHSHKAKKGDLDLERFTGLDQVRKDLRPWEAVLEMLATGEMPPKKKPQPRPEERQRLVAWVRGVLDTEARAQAGDPGRVGVRRLSNAEYNNTVRDLTGVDLQPARAFPADGAAGEGFTNAADALGMSPTLLNRYFAAAKEIAAHAVLLPDGFRFSPSKTRRDWTDEALADLRKFYPPFTPDGKLPLRTYLAATIRHRQELAGGKVTVAAVAAREKLNGKYLEVLWRTLNDRTASFPLDGLRARWRQATLKDSDGLVADIAAWQNLLWQFSRVGSYMNPVWQVPARPTFVDSQTIKVPLKPAPNQKEVVLYLVARALTPGKEGTYVAWGRPRLEGGRPAPLFLRDVARLAGQFEIDYQAIFAETGRYLRAAAPALRDRKLSTQALARQSGLDATLLGNWIKLLAAGPAAPAAPAPLERLATTVPEHPGQPAIHGWGNNTPDHLPVVISNASGKAENVPGTVPPHGVAVHPSPTLFAAVVWTSPMPGLVRFEGSIAHAHPACGNGISWWLEHRRGTAASKLGGGNLDVGGKARLAPGELKVAQGDRLLLAVGARDGNHACDLTALELNITEAGDKGRQWDLARDVADCILQGNPHADRLGNKGVWEFVKGPDRTTGKTEIGIPPGSLLAQWHAAAGDGRQQGRLARLAGQVKELLTGRRPDLDRPADRALYDALTAPDSPLLRGLDLIRWVKAPARTRGKEGPHQTVYGLDPARFGRHPLGRPAEAESLVVRAPAVVEVRLPAILVRQREFVVEGRLDPASAGGVVQLQVLTAPPPRDVLSVAGTPCVTVPGGVPDPQRLEQGFADFRRSFPQYLYFAKVIPDDEIICLRLYCREDDHLVRFFLEDGQKRQLDRLWQELVYISQAPLTEFKNYPTFFGFVTQDGKAEAANFEKRTRLPVKLRAEAFARELEATAPRHIDALLDFAARAYRRPLEESEKAGLRQLYEKLRQKQMTHDEAFRTTLARVLISPSFLYRIEQPAAGREARPVSGWELATRLSYFLWATMPDAKLRQAVASGELTSDRELEAQARRMLRDPKTRGLAVEFAAQWLHVRDIRDNREKNEKLFPTYDDKFRQAIFEETILFFQDLFQADRSVLDILDADHTFLNEALARHYGIPGVVGPQWRRADGVKKYGRGGVLALASVLTKQSGASRTSPVLRGNWVAEVLLGEKIPRPPANVPRLPEEETGGENLTVRQLVEKHARVTQCAVCHVRIDPFGFALEKYDAIGRLRDRDRGGRPLDTRAQLRDGTRFEGLEGLRTYLLTQRKDDFLRQFCRKLLGYALGRTVTLSDQPLVEEMLAGLRANGHRFSAAVLPIIRSPQFRNHRGRDVPAREASVHEGHEGTRR